MAQQPRTEQLLPGQTHSALAIVALSHGALWQEAKTGPQKGQREMPVRRRSFQRGHVAGPFRSPHGTKFTIRWRVQTTTGLKHKAETIYCKTKKEAQAILAQRIKESCAVVREAIDLTFSSFLKQYWEPSLTRRNVKPSTLHAHRSSLKHIEPCFGAMNIVEILPLHIEEFLARQFARTPKLSNKTIRNQIGLMHSIFTYAKDNDLIRDNPVRRKHKPQVVRAEKTIWSSEQVKKIVEMVPASHKTLFLCAAVTRMRQGELLALQWKHIDLKNKMLRVEQSLWQGQIVQPKTAASVRDIPLCTALAEALEHERSLRSNLSEEAFVFCKPDGIPFDPDVLRRDVLYPVLDRLGIARPRRACGFHAFRHSVGSFISSQTGNIKLAQKLLGHSNYATTADIYTHTSRDDERAAALAVERAIFGDLFLNVPEIKNKNSTTAVN